MRCPCDRASVVVDGGKAETDPPWSPGGTDRSKGHVQSYGKNPNTLNIVVHRGLRSLSPPPHFHPAMSLSADDVVLECNIEILGRERPLLNQAWLGMQTMYASLADTRYPDVNAFIESCELFGVIVVTDGYFERKGALEKWDEEQKAKGEMGSIKDEEMTLDGWWPNPSSLSRLTSSNLL